MRDFFSLPVFEIGGTPVNGLTLLSAGIIILVSMLLARLLRKLVEGITFDRLEPQQRSNLRVTIRLFQYTVVGVGVLIALNMIGIHLTALFAAGALLAVAVGFAMQNVTANFVSGLILLLERSIKPGDVIEVDGQLIEIRHMAIRATIGRTLSEEDLIIPSSNLVQSVVKNYTLRDSLTRLRATVGVIYDSDMRLVRATLEETVRALAWRSQEKDPVVFMRQFGESSVDFEVSVWFTDPWRRQQRNSDLHEAIWWALKEAEVTIAYPQLDVHIDPRKVDPTETAPS